MTKCYECENCRGNANDPGFLKKEETYCEWCEEASDNFLTEDGCWMFERRKEGTDVCEFMGL